MSALAPNPQTASGSGGAAPPSLPQAGILPPAPPGGEYTDPTYLQQDAILRANINQRYGTFLDQLGYTNPATGAHTPGSIERNAAAAEDLARQGVSDADIQNTMNMDRASTLFSGYRGTAQAKLEEPYWQSIAKTELAVPEQMGKAYTGAENLVSAYNQQNLVNLGNAAARATAWSTKNPPPPGTEYQIDPTQGLAYGAGDYVAPYSDTGYATSGVPAPITPMAGGGEVTQPTNAIIGEAGPESVVPRTALTPEENTMLSGLQEAAQSRLNPGTQAQGGQMIEGGANPPSATLQRGVTGPDTVPSPGPVYPGQPGIHYFGPGGSGVAYPQVPAPPAESLYDQGNQLGAYSVWAGRHPLAMSGHAFVPDWVHDALAQLSSHYYPAGLHYPTPLADPRMLPPASMFPPPVRRVDPPIRSFPPIHFPILPPGHILPPGPPIGRI